MNKTTQKNRLHRSVLGILTFAVIMAGVLATGFLWQPTTVHGATAYYGYVTGIEKQATAYTMLGKVNAERQKVSAGSLLWDTTLENVAVIRAREAAIYFSHTRPTGAAWYSISTKVNAENLYVGYKATAATANSGWMNSTGHRTNRLNSTYKSYGAAAFQGADGSVYWVEVFSKTASASKVARNVDVSKTDLPVSVTDGYLSIKSGITTLSRAAVADTSLRVGGSYYLTLQNWNKGFTYSYSLFSRGYFSSSNTAIATIDTVTGKITPKRAGVVKVYGRASSVSGIVLNREVIIRPQAVTGLVVTAKVKSISMRWNPVAGASGFEIYRSTTLSGTYTKVASVSAAATTYTNSGLTTGTTYYYKVRSYVLKSGSTTRYTGYDSVAVAAKVL